MFLIFILGQVQFDQELLKFKYLLSCEYVSAGLDVVEIRDSTQLLIWYKLLISVQLCE